MDRSEYVTRAIRAARQHNHEANRYARLGYGGAAYDQRVWRDRAIREARRVRAGGEA